MFDIIGKRNWFFAFSLAIEAQRPLRSGVLALVASLPVALSGIVATNSISGMESILTFLGIALFRIFVFPACL